MLVPVGTRVPLVRAHTMYLYRIHCTVLLVSFVKITLVTLILYNTVNVC